METYGCPVCKGDVEIESGWESFSSSKKFPCPTCNTIIFLDYEESYDDETGEAYGWFYLEKA